MKKLWILPLAALLCGSPVDPPRLKAPLPGYPKRSCEEAARREYLQAYAYREESGSRSLLHLARADSLLKKCEEPRLRSRWMTLRKSFP